MHLYGIRSQNTIKCGKNILIYWLCLVCLFLLLPLHILTSSVNLFVKYTVTPMWLDQFIKEVIIHLKVTVNSSTYAILFSALPVGDACVEDYDGDGVPDVDDTCPHAKHISKTSFLDHFTVDLYPGHSDPVPEWRVAKMVKKKGDLWKVLDVRFSLSFPLPS